MDILFRKFVYLSLIPLAFLLLAGAFHHHPDGLKHDACSICCLTAHHSEYSSQAVLLPAPVFVPLQAVAAGDSPFRSFLPFGFCPGRSPPACFAHS
jgi:hypothetical protein